MFDTVYGKGKEWGLPWWLAGFLAMLAATPLIVVQVLTPLVGWIVVHLFLPWALVVVDVLKTIRNTPSEAANELITDVLGEFFGADFDSSNLNTCVGEVCNTERAVAIGGDILGLLEREFAPNGEITPDQGLQGAQAFAGFATNFAVRSATIGLLGEFASFGFIEGFRNLGEDIARNLSIGRQVRLAMRPFFDILIAQPLQWYLHTKYRQKLLDPTQAIKANFRGELSDSDLATELSYAGLTDGRQASLIADTRPQFSAPEIAKAFLHGATDKADALDRFRALGWNETDANLWIAINQPDLPIVDVERLVRWGTLGREDAINLLQDRGYSGSDADLLLTSNALARADAEVSKFVEVLKTEYLDGFLAAPDFRDAINALPLATQEAQWLINVYGQLKELPRKVPTIAEMRKAYEQAVIDLAEWEDYLKIEGFSPDDQLILTESLLLDAAQKAAAAKTKATRTSTKTKKPPPAD